MINVRHRQVLSISLSINVWVYANLIGIDYFKTDALSGSVYSAVVSVSVPPQPQTVFGESAALTYPTDSALSLLLASSKLS